MRGSRPSSRLALLALFTAFVIVVVAACPVPASAAQQPLPVVLVHGVSASADCWDGVPDGGPWVNVLRAKKLFGVAGERKLVFEGSGWKLFKGTGSVFGSGVPVYVFDYSKNTGAHGDIKGIARDFGQALGYVAKDSGRPKAFIVAHSMGGLVTREAMADTKSARIAGVITLDTPHKGCSATNDMGPGQAKSATLNPAGDQMKPGSDFLKGLNSTSIGTTKADKISGFDVVVGNYYIYWGDGVLSEDEQIPPDSFFNKSDGSSMTPRVTYVDAIHTDDKLLFDIYFGPGLNEGRSAQGVPVVAHGGAIDAAKKAYAWCVASQPAPPASLRAAAPPPPSAAPGVAVARESGTSPCLIEKITTVGGKTFVSVDYIQLKRVPDDYVVVNNNARLRTFEFDGDSWIGAFWLAKETYGTDAYPGPDGSLAQSAAGRGVPFELDDLKRAVEKDRANHFPDGADRWWTIRVDDGRVVSLVEDYQD